VKNNIITPIIILSIVLGMTWSSCEVIDSVLSDAQVADGLKEALRVGTDTAVYNGNKSNGYFGNELIKILMPSEGQAIIDVISLIPGGTGLVDEVVLKLNRAAEEAAVEATPIFVDAITNLTITDALNILNGSETAATDYLNTNTSAGIHALYQPKIEDALTSVGAQQAWTELIGLYNQIPLVSPVNSDLADYTTGKAKDGLFHLVGEEEKLIRTDATHRVNEILQNVFGGE
jgi:hypothetical protein